MLPGPPVANEDAKGHGGVVAAPSPVSGARVDGAVPVAAVCLIVLTLLILGPGFGLF